MNSLSVIIITKNEAHDIRACLESVKWVDEIVVFDSGSTDDTVAICREFTDQVFVTDDWPGDGPQKNRALSKATGDWVLCLDADEQLSSELQTNIKNVLATSPSKNGFKLHFQANIYGKTIQHSGWGKETHLRLFKRTHGQFSNLRVHGSVHITGQIGTLDGLVLHTPYRDLDEWAEKINRYSTEVAQHRAHKGINGGILKGILHGAWQFCKSYLIKAGFLDGREGFLIAIMGATDKFLRYVKLYYLRKS